MFRVEEYAKQESSLIQAKRFGLSSALYPRSYNSHLLIAKGNLSLKFVLSQMNPACIPTSHFFKFSYTFQQHCGPEVDSASNRNGYQHPEG
jgi:hypothetical protein